MGKTVWKFTNQRELTKKEFLRYFERKVFSTIRKYGMLPKNRIIKLSEGNDLNTKVLLAVLEKKFQVKSGKGFSSANLSQVSEDIFKEVLKGNFSKKELNPEELKAPLYFLSDTEIELYAKLTKIKGIKRKKDKKIQTLFQKFTKKNPDLERNVVRGWLQLT